MTTLHLDLTPSEAEAQANGASAIARVVEPQPVGIFIVKGHRRGYVERCLCLHQNCGKYYDAAGNTIYCPFGAPGDVLEMWVNVCHRIAPDVSEVADKVVLYRRRVVSVEVKQVRDVTEEEAIAIGFLYWKCSHHDCIGPNGEPGLHYGPRGALLETLIDSCKSIPLGLGDNPLVWFARLEEVE